MVPFEKVNIFLGIERTHNDMRILAPALIIQSLFLQIFYRVVADIEPGEELLLFMKSEDYTHVTMAPDIHGKLHTIPHCLMPTWCDQKAESSFVKS